MSSYIHINYESIKLSRLFMFNAVIPYHVLFPPISKTSRKLDEISVRPFHNGRNKLDETAK